MIPDIASEIIVSQDDRNFLFRGCAIIDKMATKSK